MVELADIDDPVVTKLINREWDPILKKLENMRDDM